MSDFVPPVATVSEAWLLTLQLVHEGGGRRTNVVTTVDDPTAPEDSAVREAIDAVLVPGMRNGVSIQDVDTVANTIFPSELYSSPATAWAPQLDVEHVSALDAAAEDLYATYADMLPVLLTARGNSRGTYFGRMISWPGKESGGVNQLSDRIKRLRSVNRAGRLTDNVSDIAIGGEAELATQLASEGVAGGELLGDVGLQVYAAEDRRPRGFPCLVHIDLTLLDGRLSMFAVYRHQYLITKAYGNLLGLSRLLGFLAEQTGFAVGELVVAATLADAESGTFGGRSGVDALIRSARPTAHVV